MAAAHLTPGAVAAMSEHAEGQGSLKPVLQVVDVRRVSNNANAAERFRMLLSDGAHTLQSMLATAENHRVRDGAIVKGTVIHLQEFTCSTIQSRRIVIVIKLDILQSECAIIGNPTPYVSRNIPKEQSPNLPAAAAQTYGGTPSAAAHTYGATPSAAAQTYGGTPAAAAQTYGGTPATAAQTYGGAYSGGPGALGSSVAPRPVQVPNNLPRGGGGSYTGFQGTVSAPVDRTVEPVPNVSYGGSYGTMSAHSTLNTNMMQSKMHQPPLNSHQNQRSAVPATAGSIGPPGNTYGRPIQPLYQQAPAVYMNRGPATKNDATIHVVPVSQLNPYQSRWTIKARVTAKTDIRNYNNSKGPGKVFSFDLLDAHGGEIRTTCFNAQVDLFYDQIEVDKVYLISRGNVKHADKKYNTLNHDCEITLDHSTSIQICPDDNSIPRQQYNFRQISELENVEVGALVDLVGVVTSVSPSGTLMRKDGTETRKQTLQLKDMSGRSMEITFWGKFCDAEGQQLQLECDSGLNPILALKNGRVTEFNGRSLSTIGSTQLKVNPEFPEAEKLRHWYETEGRTSACVSLSREKSGMGRNDVRKTVSQIKDEELGCHGKPAWITIKGSISHLKPDNFFYPACTKDVNGRQCNKKVTNNGDGTWYCERCDQASPNCEYRYLLMCQIQDHTGVTFATAFQEGGTEIMGCSAQELSTIKENDEAKFDEIIQGIRFQMYLFKVKVVEETFNDESRIKCNIVKAEKLDSLKESGYVLGAIDNILQEDAGTHPEVQGAMAYSAGFNNSGQSVPPSNNAYTVNMGRAMYGDSSNQFGQQINTYGGMSTPVSAARNVYNCPNGMSRQQPAANVASSYGSSPGDAGHNANMFPGVAAVPQPQRYGYGAPTGGYNRQSYTEAPRY